MFENAKYIVLNKRHIFIFGASQKHSDIANALTRGDLVQVTSAGFIDLYEGKPRCYGESISLNIKSNEEEDSYLAKISLNLNTD